MAVSAFTPTQTKEESNTPSPNSIGKTVAPEVTIFIPGKDHQQYISSKL